MTGADIAEARLEVFARALELVGRRRVPLDEIWRVFAAAFPRRPEAVEERRWLADALGALAERGAIRMPAGRRGWDRAFDIPLPRWIEVAAVPQSPREQGWRAFPWHPALAWVADLARLTAEEGSLLRRVHDGLVARAFAEPVPVKHRSLQLLGKEKALEELTSGRLFRRGRLSLELLGCEADIPPLAREDVGPAAVALILENAGAFAVARRVLTAMQEPPYGMVGFGDGSRFERSILYLLSVNRHLERIDYLGDLDGAGLAILARVQRVASAAGLPPVEPAPGLHSAMLAAAAGLGAELGWPCPAGRRVPANPEDLCCVLPESVRSRAVAVLRAGRRIPEEVLAPADLEGALVSSR
jgi:hypothetical protein